jgi:predicted phosphodiesterase
MNKVYKNHFLVIVTVTLFTVVDVFGQEPYYSPDNLNWKDNIAELKDIRYTVYLIGDGGELDTLGPNGISLLKHHVKNENNKSAIIFLGDNAYPRGIPAEGHKDRERGELALLEQIKIVENYTGKTFFIPGNHDWDYWSKGGWESIKRQEIFIEEELNRGNTFLPDLGCPGPVEIELTKDILLVIIDTQWWLHKFEKPYGNNEFCDIKNDIDFIERLGEIAENNPDKQIILAGHHPIFSNGNHGGRFTFKDHIFPLTAAKHFLYLPLPVLGSIYPISRKHGSTVQDISHPRYQLLKNNILEAFKEHKNFIYAAGHEHNLQYFNVKNQHFIVSGSGSKTKHAAREHNAGFSYEAQGFAKVIYLKSGETWIEFWTLSNEDQEKGMLVFRKNLFPGGIEE